MKTSFLTGFFAGFLGLFIGAMAGTAFQFLLGGKAEGVLALLGLLIILGVGYAAFQFVKDFLINRGFPPPSRIGIVSGIGTPFILSFLIILSLGSISPSPRIPREALSGRIAFDSAGISVMNADGTNSKRIIGDGVNPNWLPDGKRIAFLSDRVTYVINADGTNRIKFLDGEAYPAAWSPDGQHIVFVRDGIYVMNADGTNSIRLTDHGTNPDWSHDGKRITFESERDGNLEIYVMNADGTNQTRLTDNKDYDEFPTWSPDGRYIAFAPFRDGSFDIYVMNADGTNPTRLTNDKASDVSPTWSPDGKYIAFASNRNSSWEIYAMNADGTSQTRLTHEQNDARIPFGRRRVALYALL